MRVYINIIDLRGKTRKFSIEETPLKIGRNRNAQIVVEDALVSNFHAQLYIKDDALYIEDLNSKNGVFLNGANIFKQKVCLGDELRLGDTKIEISKTANSLKILKQMTPEKERKTNMALQLESEKDRSDRKRPNKKQLNYVKDAKLYAGVKGKSPAKIDAKAILFKEYLAFFFDLSFSAVIFLGSFYFMSEMDPETFKKLFMKNPNYAELFSGAALFYLVGGLIASFVFYKWNRGRDKGSLGEKILRLD